MIWNYDDVYLSIIGGIILSIACSVHYLSRGKISGMSGIYYGFITFDEECMYWKLSIMASMVLSTSIMFKIYGTDGKISKNASTAFDPIPVLTGEGYLLSMTGGLLVGIGSKVANGCTVGHGFYGIARFSKRSYIAILCFLFFGILT